MNDNISLGVALVSLGRTAYALGKYDDSLQFCQKSVDVFRTLHNRWSESFGITHIGRAYHALGSYTSALEQFAASLTICRETGIRWVMAFTLRQSSKTRLVLGDVAEAAQGALQAVAFAREIDAKPLLLDALLGAAEVLEHLERHMEAAEIAVFVCGHSSSEDETCSAAENLLKRVQGFNESSALHKNIQETSFDTQFHGLILLKSLSHS